MLYFDVLSRIHSLVKSPAIDIINVFIKEEPHKPEKARDGRWRLIAGLSVIDTTVSSILFGELIETFSDNPFETGFGLGWAPQMPGGVTAITSQFQGKEVTCADKSSWDWTAQPWLADCYIDFMLSFYVDANQLVRTIMVNHLLSVFGHRVYDLCGYRVKVPPGIVSSGSFFTIHFNSCAQHFCHDLCSMRSDTDSPCPVSVGDDTIQSPASAEYWVEMKKTGALLKDVLTSSKTFEFCGMKYVDWKSYPVYLGKHSEMLRAADADLYPLVLQSYQWLYAFDVERLTAIQQELAIAGHSDFIISALELKRVMIGV